jgi:hypothetical protein
MVESVRLAGLVDPDEAALDREFKELAARKAADDMVLDFGDDD